MLLGLKHKTGSDLCVTDFCNQSSSSLCEPNCFNIQLWTRMMCVIIGSRVFALCGRVEFGRVRLFVSKEGLYHA